MLSVSGCVDGRVVDIGCGIIEHSSSDVMDGPDSLFSCGANGKFWICLMSVSTSSCLAKLLLYCGVGLGNGKSLSVSSELLISSRMGGDEFASLPEQEGRRR